MCGIFAYYEPDQYAPDASGLAEVIRGLIGQINRGQEGVGIVAFTPGKDNVFRLEKTDLSIDRVLNDPLVFQKFQKLDGPIILGHNRYATHGSISNLHAQPMQNDPNGQFPKERRKAIVFNGNIANEHALREELEQKG